MNKELNHLLETYTDNQNFDYSCYKSIENKLKALEIIINKNCDITFLISCFKYNWGIEKYNYYYNGDYQLTEEEYDLLKEVLTCQS